MTRLSIRCGFCGRSFERPLRQINESEKLGWKAYCSPKCLSLFRTKSKNFICANPQCDKIFQRKPGDVNKSKEHYCSHRCAAIVNNRRFPKNIGVLKTCAFCGKNFKSRKKYCSRLCKDKGETVSKEVIISFIKGFVGKSGRIPFKNEFTHAHAARLRFGSWNNAVKTAGFDPNPVMFANKHKAKDGHKCDSLSEKIIDDWLYSRGREHERSVSYPGGYKLKADFKVGNYWIEFFGLNGQHKRYDELARLKIRQARKYNLNFISVFPEDLFPISKLETILGPVTVGI